MTKYNGGETVKAGFYWNRGTWGVELVPAEGGTLPGGDTTTYLRVPWPSCGVRWMSGRIRSAAARTSVGRRSENIEECEV